MKSQEKPGSTLRVALAAGGTGGHIMPAIALAEVLANIGYPVEIQFFCGNRPIEKKIYADAGITPVQIPVGGMTTGGLLSRLAQVVGLVRGMFKCLLCIRNFDVVVGMGGYSSAPLLAAAWLANVPIVLHDSNAVLGRVTRWLAPKAKALACGLPLVNPPRDVSPDRIHDIGTPVRLGISRGDAAEAARSMRFDPELFTLFICGGSQGAQGLNRFMGAVFQEMSAFWPSDKTMQVIWSAGPQNVDEVLQMIKERNLRGQFWIAPIMDRMDHAFALSDIVIARAGGSFLAEVLVCGKPSILFPLPHGADQHQHHNAAVLERNGAAVVFDENSTEPREVAEQILHFLQTTHDLEVMSDAARRLSRPGAARDLARLIVRAATGELD
ncbi:MAG TPA: UDP-N-acetylglucosamine--N-acetylmuramyl-(pentapeptide) pyrophosphoryl-undecaprenol N-acetylglucosamine transferase [Candidatus Sumerlaeota bacterium]|nr:UDP-N-acetylglucosamine--N-acetylmuramyl-(pentapeptide) pyrophosphoryl-undecaprenol N-acetylglucosamine transferase [Candidatus Sumerlaeota bacterium]